MMNLDIDEVGGEVKKMTIERVLPKQG